MGAPLTAGRGEGGSKVYGGVSFDCKQLNIYNWLYTIDYIHLTIYNWLYTIDYIQLTIYNWLYTIDYIQLTIHNWLYTIDYQTESRSHGESARGVKE